MTEYIKKIMKSQAAHVLPKCVWLSLPFYVYIRSHLIKMNFIWLLLERRRTNIPFRRFRLYVHARGAVHKKAIKSPHYVCTYIYVLLSFELYKIISSYLNYYKHASLHLSFPSSSSYVSLPLLLHSNLSSSLFALIFIQWVVIVENASNVRSGGKIFVNVFFNFAYHSLATQRGLKNFLSQNTRRLARKRNGPFEISGFAMHIFDFLHFVSRIIFNALEWEMKEEETPKIWFLLYSLFIYVYFLSGFSCCVKKEKKLILKRISRKKKSLTLAICVLSPFKNNSYTQHGVYRTSILWAPLILHHDL